MLRAVIAFSLFAGSTGCVTDEPADEADIDSIELGDDKADLPSRPTRMGTLQFERPASGELRAITSGYHLYTFAGQAGEPYRIELDSPDYRPYLRVTAPNGERWNDAATSYKHPIDDVYWAILDVELPVTGTYEIISTSVWNMRLFPLPKTSGAYKITVK